uniref:DUF4283 domain-containing protein n=1 Tax=Gossypium raimondii TaxID=29730 RepID=A0A0D2TMZ0_GOSRA|nr:hypothetical protein B456_007G282400 [Gossypium raimondii]
MDSLYESNSKGENLPRNRSTKKVRFKDLEPTSDVEMVVEPTPTPTLSWKDMIYKNEVLWEIEGMVGKVTKLDFNIDSRSRRRYAHITIYINLEKPLISQVLINGKLQRIEYECLSVVCFSCGRYGHSKKSLCVGFYSIKLIEREGFGGRKFSRI